MTPVRPRTTTLGRPFQADHTVRQPLGLVRRLLSAMLACATLPATAVSLGEIQTSSHIGDVLQLRIPLTATAEEEVNAECIRLEGPRSEAAEDFPWLRAGRLRLTRQADGQQFLQVTSLQSVQSPVIMVAVRIDCGSTLRREYTLLLNPSSANDSALSVTSPTPPASVASGTSNTLRSAKGESLRLIARNLFPADRTLQSRYVALLRKRNAAKLEGISDSALLPAGTELTVPEMSEISAAPALVERTPPPQRAARPVAAAPAPQGTEADTALTPRKSRGTSERKRLVLSGDERSGLQLATGLAGRKELSEKDREKLRTELQLIASLDDKIATQLELSEKLRQLEALQVQLQSDVQGLEARIRHQQAALQSSSAPADAKPTAAPSPGPLIVDANTRSKTAVAKTPSEPTLAWRDGLLPAGGVLVLLLLLFGIKRYRDGQRYTDAPEAAPVVSEGDQSPQPADDLFEPLSEEDIWPDAATLRRPPGARTGTDLPTFSDLGPASVLHISEDVEEHNSAVELAEIMMSFGRVHGAAQTLADFIRANPKQAVKPWVKLLEVYKTANMRPEFEALTSQLNKTFNVKSVTWDDFDIAMRAPESLEHIPHIAQKICEVWGKRECQTYLHGLLRDNRQGTRQGFPMVMVDEILLLLAILESQLGAYKPDEEPVQQAVSPPTSPTMAAPSAPQSAPPPASQIAPAKTERSALNFDLGSTDFDLGLDTQDLTRTLHINLDDLPDEATQTRFDSRKPEDT